MFYLFYKIITFIVNKEEDFTKRVLQFLTTRRQSNHIAYAIFVLHSAMKTQLWTNKNVRTIQIIL